MARKQILLPLETALRMQIAMLEHDLAQMQARLLAQDMEHRHHATLLRLLAAAQISLPVSLTACQFDAEHGALVYEETGNDAEAPYTPG